MKQSTHTGEEKAITQHEGPVRTRAGRLNELFARCISNSALSATSIFSAATVLSSGCATLERPYARAVKSGYAPVNGLRMYYEIHGSPTSKSPPLVLLHGGGSTIETSFGRVLPSFAKSRQVIAFEQQGHGHTADIDRPFYI